MLFSFEMPQLKTKYKQSNLHRDELITMLKKFKRNLPIGFQYIDSTGVICGIPVSFAELQKDELNGDEIVLRFEGRYILTEDRPIK